ncbi:chemotaxis protein CheD [Celerinatantimonas yamalensis]|uniref:Probable chemoreceptor glutamine deamidase CheD n=1 Tax=Celerinatantimonas yamalensis TaxID=559956 RepID=A0ABW9G4L2_9GAMM
MSPPSITSTRRDHPHQQVAYLYAGDIIFGRGYREVRTLLGSCIAIALWHPSHKFCGMCHFAMPQYVGSIKKTLDPRYGDHCMEIFRRSAEKRGTSLKDYQAKVFGGGNLLRHDPMLVQLDARQDLWERRSVGEQNAGAAFALLMQYGVKVVEMDVGEFCYRKIYLDTRTGEVDVVCCHVGP